MKKLHDSLAVGLVAVVKFSYFGAVVTVRLSYPPITRLLDSLDDEVDPIVTTAHTFFAGNCALQDFFSAGAKKFTFLSLIHYLTEHIVVVNITITTNNSIFVNIISSISSSNNHVGVNCVIFSYYLYTL